MPSTRIQRPARTCLTCSEAMEGELNRARLSRSSTGGIAMASRPPSFLAPARRLPSCFSRCGRSAPRAYFSTAPFVGALLSLIVFREQPEARGKTQATALRARLLQSRSSEHMPQARRAQAGTMICDTVLTRR